MTYEEKYITLANLYAPIDINCRCDFFKRTKDWVNTHSENSDNILICGDLNCSWENETDRSRFVLKQLFNKLDLHDIWKTLKGDEKRSNEWIYFSILRHNIVNSFLYKITKLTMCET
jgi:hypothetical protein